MFAESKKSYHKLNMRYNSILLPYLNHYLPENFQNLYYKFKVENGTIIFDSNENLTESDIVGIIYSYNLNIGFHIDGLYFKLSSNKNIDITFNNFISESLQDKLFLDFTNKNILF